MKHFDHLVVYLSHWFYEPPMNKLASFIVLRLFKAASLSYKWVKTKTKTKNSETIKTGPRVPKTSGQLWACWTQHPFPFHELIRYCFLTILQHFNWCTVYSTKCSLFICIYLFIWFVVLNAYLCIHILLYASEPYVKAVLLLQLS